MSAVANIADEEVLCDFWQHLSGITIILELDLKPSFEIKCSRRHPARILPLLILCENIPKDSMNIHSGWLPSAKLGSRWRCSNNRVILRLPPSPLEKVLPVAGRIWSFEKNGCDLPSSICWVIVCNFFTCLFDCIFWTLPNSNCFKTVVQYRSFLSWDTVKK